MPHKLTHQCWPVFSPSCTHRLWPASIQPYLALSAILMVSTPVIHELLLICRPWMDGRLSCRCLRPWLPSHYYALHIVVLLLNIIVLNIFVKQCFCVILSVESVICWFRRCKSEWTIGKKPSCCWTVSMHVVSLPRNILHACLLIHSWTTFRVWHRDCHFICQKRMTATHCQSDASQLWRYKPLVQLDLESGTISRWTSDSRTCHTAVSQLMITLLFGQSDKSALYCRNPLTYLH